MKTDTVKKQFVVNVNEGDKGIINNLKEELGLGDKEVIHLVLEVARNNRIGLEDDVEVDTFTRLSFALGLKKEKKAKVEKVVLSKDERTKLRLQKTVAELQAKLDAITQEDATVAVESDTADEDAPVVVIGV